MSDKNITLTNAEWSVMECLWEASPKTGREITDQLERAEGWNRSTTLTLLSRLETKGAVISDTDGRKKTFSPLLRREDAALHEAEDFLSRVYKGSLSLMVSSLTKKKALPKEEIDQLYAMLKKLEEVENDD